MFLDTFVFLANQDQEAVEPVINDLSSMLLKLETDHPYTAGLLNRMADLLANLGI